MPLNLNPDARITSRDSVGYRACRLEDGTITDYAVYVWRSNRWMLVGEAETVAEIVASFPNAEADILVASGATPTGWL